MIKYGDFKIVFFGTPYIATVVLDMMEMYSFTPDLIVTNPDAPQGRHMELTPPPAKVWAQKRDIQVLQPESLASEEVHVALNIPSALFIVAAYGKIIPKTILDIPKYGTLNMHPSLLPKFRGASPIRSAILADDRDTGVTIMLMDEKLDHGPILAQEHIIWGDNEIWPLRGRALDERLAAAGGRLLCETILPWLDGSIVPKEQDHAQATFSTKITKEMGEIDLTADPYQNLLKIRAFDGWPSTFFFAEKKGARIRVKITDAELAPDGSLNILRVIPEGKNEMAYEDFLRNYIT